ncbi:MAG: VCBS repeat-containing protein [Phycisphaerales bacterium]|nr:VCBS repeat-containing protein [Phycisphaerales bacterium]
MLRPCACCRALVLSLAALTIPQPARAQMIIVDNVDTGFSVLSGGWSTSDSAAGHYGANYAYLLTTGGGGSLGEVEWRPTLAATETFTVDAFYPSLASRPDNATYSVHHAGGVTDVVVNQQVNGGMWISLGTYTFNAGTGGYVTLDSDANGTNIVADAVRFVSVANPPLFTNIELTALNGFNVDARSASLADIDNDGDLDLFFQGATGAQQLFRNNFIGTGSLDFTNISSQLPAGLTSSWSACWGDYDGDGDVDVFIGKSNSGVTGTVLRNDGIAGFTDTSVAVGLDDPGFHQNVAWSDIDGDLDLDLVLAMEGPELNEIYIQVTSNSFIPVGASVGFQQPLGYKAYGMAIGDSDGDGDMDVYISTCRGDNNVRNNFYENQTVESGSLDFIDIADANGTQNMRNTYNAEFHDFDDDGDLDLYVVGADGQLTKIYRNDGSNQFTDVDAILGHDLLDNNGGDYNGGRAIDYDNDGDLDLYLHDHLANNGHDQARRLYRNDGNWNFTDVTAEVGIDFKTEGAYDSAWADIDRDGDLDLIAPTNVNSPERIFLNGAQANGNHWLQVRLLGPSSNTTAIGAAIYATIHYGTGAQRTLRRDANVNAATFNQSDLPVHFGLGNATVIDKLRIVWPGGVVQNLCNVAVDQFLTVHRPTPGDFDGDGDVDQSDFAAFVDCLNGPVSPPAPSSAACADACAALDVDLDNDVDLADLAGLVSVFAE